MADREDASNMASDAPSDKTASTDSPSAALSAAIQALTQANQVLTMAAAQLVQEMQGRAGEMNVADAGQAPPGAEVLAAPPSQINIWEHDPDEPVSTPKPVKASPVPVDVPVVNAPLLQVTIVEPQPSPARYAPGTAGFLYWTAAEALARGIGFWARLLPVGTRWSTVNPALRVTLVAGRDLIAFYSRQAGLRFFQQTVRNVTVFSGESPDVVCHELGHAILDALRPQLFHTASIEAAAFHEAFGDISSILVALQLPTLRQKVLAETQGQLNVNSRLSRLAEQLGWAVRQLFPTAVDGDSLRNAVNQFFYQEPALLPPRAPASQLSSEPHSFSRLFTGGFLNALAGMLAAAGAANDPSLLAVTRELGQLLVDGVRTAPITATYFSQVAAAMIQADRARNNGRYREALTTAFVRCGILSPADVASLARAPVPRLQAGPEPPVEAAMAGFDGGATGARTLLTYGDRTEDDAYRRGFADLPDLPVTAMQGEFGLDVRMLAHVPAEQRRFNVAGAAPHTGSVETPRPEQAALYFVEDLIRLGRIDLGATTGGAADLGAPTEDKTHRLTPTNEGMVLERLHFDCGLRRRC